MALTTLPQLRAFHGLSASDTSQDAQLDMLRGAAEAVVLGYLGRNLERQSYTEYYAGNNTKWLVLRQRPVTALTSIYEDFSAYGGTGVTPFAATTLLTAGVDYVLDYDNDSTTASTSGKVFRINYLWSDLARVHRPGVVSLENGPALGNIKVTYTAGYATVPLDVQYVVAYLTSYMKRTVQIGGNLTSEKIGEYAYHLSRLSARDVPELGTLRQMLAKYREVPW